MPKNTVIRSINAPGEHRCVDIFKRPDGTFGFEEYRRDSEDSRGWFAVGSFGGRTFGDESAAFLEARNHIPWLRDVDI